MSTQLVRPVERADSSAVQALFKEARRRRRRRRLAGVAAVVLAASVAAAVAQAMVHWTPGREQGGTNPRTAVSAGPSSVAQSGRTTPLWMSATSTRAAA